MNVLVIGEQLRQPVPGGIGTYVLGLMQGLRQMRRDAPPVSVHASRYRPPDNRGRAPLHDPVGGFPVIASRLPSRWLLAAWTAGVVGVPAPARNGGGSAQWDVVHAPSLAFPRRGVAGSSSESRRGVAGSSSESRRGVAGSSSESRRGRAPLAVVVNDLAWRQVPEAFTRHGVAWHEKQLRRVLDTAALVMVPCDETATALEKAAAGEAGVRSRRVPRIEVITYGVDHLAHPDVEGADALLDQLGVNGAFVICVGTREPRKNLERLIAAFGQARLGSEWWLVVAGPEGWGEQGRDCLPSGVVFTGPVPAEVLSGLYARAGMAAYVPLTEGWGLPAVEAMAAGIPVVASPVPSTRGAALEVDPRDTGQIAEGLVAVATDAAVRRSLIEAGSRRVAGMTWLETARRHVALWESIGG